MTTTSRRSPTANQLQTWRAFVETTSDLTAQITARMQRDSGLSSGDYAVLLALSEAGEERLRSSDLAVHIGWERSRLSHHLGRMEKRALIRRQDCPTDNRGAEVAITAEGAQAFRQSNPSHLRAIRELFIDALTPEQLDAAAEITEALAVHLRGGFIRES